MLKFSNAASAQLAANISSTATTLSVEPGKGLLFPSITPPDTFQAVLFDASGLFEIVTCTARNGDVMTVVRGREGSLARSWTTSAKIELRLTAGVLEQFLQLSGGRLTGALDMNGNQILNAVLPQTSEFTSLRVGTITPLSGVQTHQIGWLRSGRFSVGGPNADDASVVVTRAELRYMVFFYSGPSPIPTPWILCNGLNGTPDLRDRFLIMAGASFPQDSKSEFKQSNQHVIARAAGGQPASRTGMTTLTIAQIPAHTHAITPRQTSSNNTGTVTAGTSGTAIADGVTSSTGGGQGHDHSIAAIPAHTHEVDLPGYYALAPVMYNPALL